MKLSINNNIVNKPMNRQPQQRGWHNAEFDNEQFQQHIRSGLAWSHGYIRADIISSKKPAAADIEGAYLIGIDIDNTTKKYDKNTRKYIDTRADNYWSIQDAANHPFVLDNGYMLYTSPSNTNEHNKFRLIFRLEIPITDNVEFKNTAKKLINYFGGDRSCCNIDRMFYGNTDADIIMFDNILRIERLELLPEPEPIVNSNQVASSHYATSSYTDNTIKPDYNTIRDMLSYIDGTAIEYNEWLRIVSAIGNIMPDGDAVRLVDEWSPDKDHGTAYKVQNRLQEPNISTIIHFAKRFGYNVKKLYTNNVKNSNNNSNNVKNSNNIVKFTDNISEKNENNTENHTSYYNFLEKFILDLHTTYRYNTITALTEFTDNTDDTINRAWTPITDRDVSEIWRLINQKSPFKREFATGSINNLLLSDIAQSYNPLLQYFDNLPAWDGNDYISELAYRVIVSTHQVTVWPEYLRRWLVALVANAMERGVNHTCLVLAGEQGIGKTQFARMLVPDELTDYYTEEQLNPRDKDSKICITENFLINLEELESINREEIGYLKALMTTKAIKCRRAYGRRTERAIRRASFIGNVNRAAFLTDMTGNRRFLIVTALDINYQSPINLNQLYAQAKNLLDSGFRYWFTHQEIQTINEFNSEYEVINCEQDMVQSLLEPVDTGELTNDDISRRVSAGVYKYMTATEIYDKLQEKTRTKLSINKLGQILKKLGFMRKGIYKNNRTIYKYLVKERTIYDNDIFRDNEDNEFPFGNAANF